MDRDQSNDGTYVVRSRRYTWLLPVAILIAIVAIGGYFLAETTRDLAYLPSPAGEETGSLRFDERLPGEARGTTGARGATGEGPVATSGDAVVIKELETITGTLDGNELIGRRVDLHVVVQQEGTPTTFWVGSPDNRLLVVLQRDVRDGRAQQTGLPPSHGIVPVHTGQMATVSGTIQPLPDEEERYSWNLTREQRGEVESRGIFLRADSVTTEGHGE